MSRIVSDRPALVTLDVGEAGGLDLIDQPADDIKGSFKYGGCGFASEAECGLQGYLEHGCYIDLSVRPEGEAGEGQLVSGASPIGFHHQTGVVAAHGVDPVAVPLDHSGREYAVCIPVPDLVHGPEGPIPSLIWSAGYDDLQNICMKVVAFPLKDLGFHGDGGRSEGVFAFLGIGLAPSQFGAGVERMVERIAKVSEDAFRKHGEASREPRLEADLRSVLAGLRIEIYNAGPIVLVNESGGKFIESADVFLRLFQVEPSAIKRVVHA